MNTDKLLDALIIACRHIDMDRLMVSHKKDAETIAAALRAEQAYKAPADLKLGETIYTPPGEEVRFAYTRGQPNNMNAWRLGEACRMAADASAGDYIDRGLGLLKELEERGYGVFRFVADAEQAVGEEQRARELLAEEVAAMPRTYEACDYQDEYKAAAIRAIRRALGTARQSEGVVPNYAELLAAVRSVNGLHCLGDAIYDVREREGEGWEGPNVLAYSAACEIITNHLAAAPGGEGEVGNG